MPESGNETHDLCDFTQYLASEVIPDASERAKQVVQREEYDMDSEAEKEQRRREASLRGRQLSVTQSVIDTAVHATVISTPDTSSSSSDCSSF